MAELQPVYKRRTGDRVNIEPGNFDSEVFSREPIGDEERAEADEVPEGAWALGESAGAGFYYSLYDGERVEDEESRTGYETVGRGKDGAQEEIDRRNEEGLTPGGLNG